MFNSRVSDKTLCREPNVFNYLGTPYLLQRPVRYALGDIVDVGTSRAGKAITGALSLRITRLKNPALLEQLQRKWFTISTKKIVCKSK